MKVLSWIANLIWLVVFGFWIALLWMLLGALLCLSIVGIPFGIQCFKVAKLMLAPFGKIVITCWGCHPFVNTIWAIFFGWEMFIAYATSAFVMCATIIGFPIGVQILKMSILALFPFGAQVKSVL